MSDFSSPSALSRPFRLEDIPERGLDIEIEATAQECAALAEQYDIPEVISLKAKLNLKPHNNDLMAKGEVIARIVQTCVISLEDFETTVKEPVSVTFSARQIMDFEGDVFGMESENEEDIEPLVNGIADVGQLVAEFVALGMDPYPRKPGAHFNDQLEDEPEPEKLSPFLKLKEIAPDKDK